MPGTLASHKPLADLSLEKTITGLEERHDWLAQKMQREHKLLSILDELLACAHAQEGIP